jgi:trk system potassium uptake protein TrkA
MVMSIVIVGAGDIGCYMAAMLSKEQHNVILIDKNNKILEEVAFSLDVATRQGSGTDWQLLDDLLELSPSLLIALTGDDETNLVTCSIAKHLGYPRTVARVRDNRYLNRTRLDFGRIFDIDYFLGPELLVANDILKYLINPGSLLVENFAHGAVQMRTFAVPTKWRKFNIPLSRLHLPSDVMIGLICRDKVKQGIHTDREREIIFPHGDDFILPGDEVTLIGETDKIDEAHHFFGIIQKTTHSVAIVGGSLTSMTLAKLLEHRSIDVRVIEKDYEVCCMLADQLPKCDIINADATSLEFLKAEKIGRSDIFVACTRNDEINLMTGMLARQAGCHDVVVMLSNTSYASLVTQLGLNYSVSPRISAANHILSQVLAGNVTSLVSLYENRAEIMEINVSANSKIIGIPLAELGQLFPKDFLIAVIQNRGRIMIAHGSRIISPGDSVIVITSPEHTKDLEKIF